MPKYRKYRWSIQIWDKKYPACWWQGNSNIPKTIEEVNPKRGYSNYKKVRTTKKLNSLLRALANLQSPPNELQVYDIKNHLIHIYHN